MNVVTQRGASALGLAALVGIGLAMAGIRPRVPEASASVVVRDGDAVVGAGTIVRRGGTTLLCRAGPSTDQMEPQAPWCTTIQVTLDGLEFVSLPASESIGDTTFVRTARVSGAWTGGALHVSRVEVAPAEGSDGVELTCQPVGPVRPTPTDDLLVEAQVRSLADEVNRSPDRYAGYWNAPMAGGGEFEIVAVAGDPNPARDRVAAVFSLPFCVVQVRHSMAILDATAAARTPNQASRTLVDVRRNQVRLLVPLLTEADQHWLAEHPAATAAPLVSTAGD